MKILGIEMNQTVVSVGITVIVCGAITFYCHKKFQYIEQSIMKQNQVLSSFIANVQN